jgi:hypothetical protein
MAPLPSAGTRRPQRSVLLWTLAGLLTALVVFLGTVSLWWRRPNAPAGQQGRWAIEDSPFRNVRPEVPYTGDAVCAQCHPAHAESFRQHPMGRSLVAVSHSPPLERYGPEANNGFERLGFRFVVERPGERMVHRAQRLDGGGHVLAEAVTEVTYAVGSGTRGRSYLIERDGYLFQSPISWFSEKDAWDLSPGFEAIYPPDRMIEPACLFCHANRAEAVPHSRNHYRQPIFRGEAIGCERCHGPGQLHVASRERGEMPTGTLDDTIVNPRHLEPALREAVCQQCHLQGIMRVLHQGRDVFDYRPGLPLHAFSSVFVRKPEFQDDRRAVGQVEQMYQSRCFQASAGKMGCISCHDPHVLPEAGTKVAYFRGRCLSCHRETGLEGGGGAAALAGGCALSPAERSWQDKEGSCIACHMPRMLSSNIAHTAITDHRIVRKPEPVRSPQMLRPGEVPIVNFFAAELRPHDASAERDLGIALINLAPNVPDLREVLTPLGLPLLEKAVREAPDDAEAWEAKGCALALLMRREEALAAFDTALRLAPQRERVLSIAAQVADRLGRDDAMISYFQRGVAANPWSWSFRYNLALCFVQRQEWRPALEEAEAALRLNPTHLGTRQTLVTCCLRTGDQERARKEFETLLALYPADAESLRRWFAEQKP